MMFDSLFFLADISYFSKVFSIRRLERCVTRVGMDGLGRLFMSEDAGWRTEKAPLD